MRAIPIVLLAVLLAGNARGEPVDALAGDWRGALQATGGDAAGELPIEMRLDPSRRGFAIAVTMPVTAPFQARMVPGPAPNIFEEEASGGLFSFLETGDDRSVLEGRPLLWARQTAAGLVAYRLENFPEGNSELLRIVIEPAADQLEVVLERRLDGVAGPELHGVLDRRS